MTIRRHVAIAVGLLGLGAQPVSAQMLLDLHDKVREGRKLCLATHYHDGEAVGRATKKEAEVGAIRAWQDFTAWEYGRPWGSFAVASSRTVKCEKLDNGWKCAARARPCSRGR
jgi:hypothetical protein